MLARTPAAVDELDEIESPREARIATHGHEAGARLPRMRHDGEAALCADVVEDRLGRKSHGETLAYEESDDVGVVRVRELAAGTELDAACGERCWVDRAGEIMLRHGHRADPPRDAGGQQLVRAGEPVVRVACVRVQVENHRPIRWMNAGNFPSRVCTNSG